MKRISPNGFQGPRVYFTGFDHRIVSGITGRELFEKNIERRMKLLLLHKTTMVCAASHLKTEFAYQFFKKHPELLRESLVLPLVIPIQKLHHSGKYEPLLQNDGATYPKSEPPMTALSFA
jgi:hypothetical protein